MLVDACMLFFGVAHELFKLMGEVEHEQAVLFSAPTTVCNNFRLPLFAIEAMFTRVRLRLYG